MVSDARQKAKRQDAYARGLDAEDQAAALLETLGLYEIDRRARMQGGEIDLVVEDTQSLVFVEVKARKSLDEGAGSISARQQARIRTAIRHWLSTHDPQGARLARQSVRCDVVLVAPGHEPVHIPNAFPAAEETF
ncbi:MAG: YraN family protein [Pseudomonadota bacterium]